MARRETLDLQKQSREYPHFGMQARVLEKITYTFGNALIAPVFQKNTVYKGFIRICKKRKDCIWLCLMIYW